MPGHVPLQLERLSAVLSAGSLRTKLVSTREIKTSGLRRKRVIRLVRLYWMEYRLWRYFEAKKYFGGSQWQLLPRTDIKGDIGPTPVINVQLECGKCFNV